MGGGFVCVLVMNFKKKKKKISTQNTLFTQDQELYSFSIQHLSNHPSLPVIYSRSELIRHQAIRAQLYKKRRNIKQEQLVGSPSLSASDKEMKEIIACTCFFIYFASLNLGFLLLAIEFGSPEHTARQSRGGACSTQAGATSTASSARSRGACASSPASS